MAWTIEIGTNALQDNKTCKAIKKKHLGQVNLVIPVTMMVEGVHNGSQGPILHPIAELGHFPSSWNGIPIVVNHPQIDGAYISANSPDIIDSVVTVGRVYHTEVNGNKLQAEAWLVEEKLATNAPDVLNMINKGIPVEVSVGVFTENEPITNGDWNGEQYTHIARNHRPDHLALLPGSQGACSIDDGCGMGVNKEELIINKEDKKMAEKQECGQCMEKVVAIINANAGFTKEDREWLLTQDEAILDKILSKRPAQVNEVKLTPEEVLAAMSAEDKAVFDYGRKQLAQKKADLVSGIQSNTSKELWPDAELNAMNLNMLEKIYKSVKKEEEIVADYSLNRGGSLRINDNKGIDPMGPTGVELE